MPRHEDQFQLRMCVCILLENIEDDRLLGLLRAACQQNDIVLGNSSQPRQSVRRWVIRTGHCTVELKRASDVYALEIAAQRAKSLGTLLALRCHKIQPPKSAPQRPAP